MREYKGINHLSIKCECFIVRQTVLDCTIILKGGVHQVVVDDMIHKGHWTRNNSFVEREEYLFFSLT